MQFHRILPSGLALIAVLAGSLPVQAVGYPGSGAPMVAAKKLQSDGSDPGNPFSYPFLMDIAKSLARSGLPSGFFLSAESKSNAVDLRPIILLEAGILRSPVRMLLPGKKKEESAPTLSLPTIPDTPADNPLRPKIESPSLTFVPPGTPRRIDPLSVNLRDFNTELAPDDKRPQLSLMEPDRTADNLMFRLWTVRDESLPESKPARQAPDYRGSFVQVTPGALNAIEGRVFQLKQGRALACARGKAIVFDSPIARVTVEPGAAAIVEYAGKDALLVRVLESTGSDRPVKVSFKSGASREEVQVSPKEEFLVSTKKLTDAERDLLQEKGKATGEDTWLRSKFQPVELLDKDALLRANLPRMTSEQRSAVNSLRARLK